MLQSLCRLSKEMWCITDKEEHVVWWPPCCLTLFTQMSILALLLYLCFLLQGRAAMPLIPCLNILYGKENIPAWTLSKTGSRPTLGGLWCANCLKRLALVLKDRYRVKRSVVYYKVCASVPVWHSWGPIFNKVPSCHWSLLFPLNGDVEKQWHMGKASETLYWPTTINTHLAFTFLFPKVINEKNRSIWLLTADFPAGPCP